MATIALRQLEESLPWYRAMPPQDRSWVGLVAQAGIAGFTSWYRDPTTPLTITADVFGRAPRELTRSVTLSQTLQLVRTIVQVVEDNVGLLALPGYERSVRESALRYSREVAFAAAELYAEAAEARGAWDARLEALVVDALLRGDADD
ncbi:MAG: PucR family transcriptional regulator, partial [Actinomycetes bacterium]